MQIGYWGESPSMEATAKELMETLWWAYPGHPWFVRVWKGLAHIRWLDDKMGNYGMAVKLGDVDHDAAVLKRQLIFNAGELLERAGISRGQYVEGQEVAAVEGVPEPKTFADANLVAVKEATTTDIPRETPHPQVLKP